MSPLAGMEIVVSGYMEHRSYGFMGDKIITDNLETIDAVLNEEFLRACGISPIDPPVKFIGRLTI